LGDSRPRSQANALGDAIEPAADRFLSPNGASLSNQDQKSRLKDILGFVNISKGAPANAENHGAMSAHEKPKGTLVSMGQEPLQ
jgi:hypothetical protein